MTCLGWSGRRTSPVPSTPGKHPRLAESPPSLHYMKSTEFVIVGCGPAGGTAAREAARAGVETLVLERDAVVGAKRVCAAGLRPGFCEEFDLPRSIVHLDPPRIALHTGSGQVLIF